MDYSPPGFSIHGLLQARILKWVVIPISRGSSQPRDRTQACCIAGRFFTDWVTREGQCGTVMVLPLLFFIFSKLTMVLCVYVCVCFPKICSSLLYLGGKNMNMKVAQSCPTLYGPLDYSLPGSSVHGIFQARILKWVAISYSRGSSSPTGWTHISWVSRVFPGKLTFFNSALNISQVCLWLYTFHSI